MPLKLLAFVVLVVAILCSLMSCGPSMKPEDFASYAPRFIPEEYFSGKLKGQGMFYDRFENVRMRFTIDLEGSFDGEVLTLKENLLYETGEKLFREYRLRKLDQNTYRVETADMPEPGTIVSYGNALRWSYRLKQKIGESIWTLSFDDWMFLQQDGLVLNRAFASKWGFRVGEVFMVVQKL